MNDDRPNLEVFQQCRHLVFGDWTSAAIFVPLRVWIGEKLLHHLLRCDLRAVLGKHRPQCREELNSRAGLIWSTREVNRRPTRLLGPSTTEELKGELERLRKENAALRKGTSLGIRLKVSEKGAVSVYGMGRFPVTLYKEQWLKLLDMSDDIRAFIAANQGQLKEKD
jgi:hypothetical protein